MNITFDLNVFSIAFTTICTILIYIVARRGRRPAGITEDIRAYVNRKIGEAPLQQGRQTDHSELQRLRDAIGQMRVEINGIRGRSVPLEITNEPMLDPVTPAEPVPPAEQVFYLPTPNPDGSFPAPTLSGSYREGASIYQMTLPGGNGEHAVFQLCRDETAIRLALQYVELRIDPCCRALNACTGATRNIILDSPGRLELRGDRWVVTDKASIHYEN